LRSFKLRPIHIWMGGLAVVTGIGAVAGIMVFARGLVLTNLTDLVPWGLWITIDLSSIALSAGAFTVCAAVYLLGLKQYQPVARTATFIGLIGYSMALLTLLLDIGRPDRFWHALVFWNTHSVLWEVSMCLTLYLGVLALETIPIISETEFMRSRWPGLSKRLESIHNLAPYLAVAGLFLSMLHQSSLGAAFGVLKARPFWYRPGISVLFIISAAAGGISFTVLVSMLSSRLSRGIKVKDELLERLALVVGWILVGYLYFRFWDAFSMTYTYEPGRTEGLALLTKGPLAFNFWVGEILLGALIPIVLLLNSRTRSIGWVRMLALLMVVGGVVAYRWDTILAGSVIILTYLPHEMQTLYTSYTPSLIEFLSGAGVIAYGILAITIGVRYLRVVDHTDVHEAMSETRVVDVSVGAD
ncbi:MAG: polysulfide reductase NrfD, partial [Anaerolineales bacterium]|nr:polysulfide reductase NrfD [Anaerolineales bacterium]